MAIAPYRYTLKRTAKLWGSLGFCSVFSDNFFVVTYTCLSLVLTIDFCYSQLTFFCNLFKKTQNKISKKKTIKYSEKKWIHSRRVRGGPTFKLRRLSWGPTFKLWRGAQGPGSRGPGPTFTPCLGCSKFYVRWSLCYAITIAQKVLCILLVLCISNVCLNSPKLIAIQSNWKKRRYFSCYNFHVIQDNKVYSKVELYVVSVDNFKQLEVANKVDYVTN